MTVYRYSGSYLFLWDQKIYHNDSRTQNLKWFAMSKKLRCSFATSEKIFSIYELKSLRLPTNGDIISAILFGTTKTSAFDYKTVYKTLSEKIFDIWQQTTIPLISIQRVLYKLKVLHTQYLDLFKSKLKPSFKQTALSFKNRNDIQLFDISLCKCSDICHCPMSI